MYDITLLCENQPDLLGLFWINSSGIPSPILDSRSAKMLR